MTYVIAGATGHIGGAIARTLLDQGHQVRVIGRDRQRLDALVRRGAEPAIGDLHDAAFVGRALRGAVAAFLLVPPNPAAPDFRAYQNAVGGALAAGLSAAGLPPTVFLSSNGAHLSYGVGPIAGLFDVEQRLNALTGLRAVHLRPAYFFENLLHSIGLIRSQGIHGAPARGDAPLPMIATADIAARAAQLLIARDFTGVGFQELHGPRDYSLAEATSILGAAIGKPDLAYVQFPPEAARQAMIGMGLSPDLADRYLELYRSMTTPDRWPGSVQRSPATTTPTTLERWAAADFAAAWAAR